MDKRPWYIWGAMYLFWIALFGAEVFILLHLRTFLLLLFRIYLENPYLVGFLDKSMLVFMGIGVIGSTVFLEGYLRKGVERDIFGKRIIKTTIIHGILIAFFLIFEYFITKE